MSYETLGDCLRRALLQGERKGTLSRRYRKGLASYGKKVKTEKRKERILAELKAMGVKPRVRRKMGKKVVGTKAWEERKRKKLFYSRLKMYS